MIVLKASNIITSLGWTSSENYFNVSKGISGITLQRQSPYSDVDFPASVIDEERLQKEVRKHSELGAYTRLEQLSILSLIDTLEGVDTKDNRLGFVFSSTKGNVDELAVNGASREAYLGSTAQEIADYFKMANQPYIVSNACISGVAAFVLAQRLINAGKFDNVVVLGADVLSKFIVSGFQSFQSLSPEPCKPFDANRDGLSLGEGVASVLLSKTAEVEAGEVTVENGAISNDANHISGPSRTGEGLYRAIKRTLKDTDTVDVISAHGTATPYNDDMESHAIFRAGLKDVPANSLKGFFGHTLGAAGVIESIISVKALQDNTILGTKGMIQQGVVQPITVATENIQKPISGLLKLMSGFGGCNAAVYFKKN